MDDPLDEENAAFLHEVAALTHSLEVFLKLLEAKPYPAFCALMMEAGAIAAGEMTISYEEAIAHFKHTYDMTRRLLKEGKNEMS